MAIGIYIALGQASKLLAGQADGLGLQELAHRFHDIKDEDNALHGAYKVAHETAETLHEAINEQAGEEEALEANDSSAGKKGKKKKKKAINKPPKLLTPSF